MDVSAKIGKYQIKNPIFNAAGPWATTHQDLNVLFASGASVVLTKTCSQSNMQGNRGKVIHYEEDKSMNSVGLKNKGLDYYLEYKPSGDALYFISITDSSIKNIIEMIDKILKHDHVAGIEINISCPNIKHSYYFLEPNVFSQLLDELSEIETDKAIGLKLPYLYHQDLERICYDIDRFQCIDFITCINTIPGFGLNIDSESTIIKPNEGVCGIGGPSIKPFGLHNVKIVSEYFSTDDVCVIGCGGITNEYDAFEYILTGADAVQVGTDCHRSIDFKDRNEQFMLFMHVKDYQTLNDFKGQYKK